MLLDSQHAEIAIAITVLFVSTLTFFLGYSIGRATGTNKINLSLKDDSSSEDTSTIVQSKSGLSLKSYIESAVSNDTSTSDQISANSSPAAASAVAAAAGPLSVSSVRSNGYGQLSSPGRTSLTNSTLAIGKRPPTIVDESSPSASSNRKYFSATTVNRNVSKDEAGYISTVEKAKEMLFAMSGLPPGFVISRVWKSVYSDANSNANIWIEKAKKEKEGNSILLRGTFFVPDRSASSSVSSIVKWLIEEDLLTAIEGLTYRSEVIEKIKNESELIVVRKMYCKSGIMSTKREFIVVTSVTYVQADGSYIIATRSMNNDINTKLKSSKSNGYVKSLVFGSGYIIRPSFIAGKSCEIFIGANVDLMGSKSVRMLTSKTDVLVCASIRTMKRIQNGCADSFVPDQLMSAKRKKSPKMLGEQSFDKDLDSMVSEDDAQVDLTDPQREELVVVSRQAMQKLRKLHSLIGFAIEDDESDHSANKKNSWEVFYKDDSVTLRELSVDSSPVGILSASCYIEASPSIVRSCLIEHPEAVDGVLEGRSMMMFVTQKTYVQWLAYGAIYPSTARDLLLVTSEEEYKKDKKGQAADAGGFVIASTSIDDLCEIKGGPGGKRLKFVDEPSHGEAICSGLDNYSRTILKLAGYVATVREGGTELTLILDLSQSYDLSTPGWLIQLLAQYGLVEMMRKIKKEAETAMDSGGDLMNANPNSASQANSSELSKILANIQQREVKISQFLEEKSVSRPPPSLAVNGVNSSPIKKQLSNVSSSSSGDTESIVSGNGRERLRSLSFSQPSSSSRNIIPLPPSVPNRTSRSNTMVTSNSSISSATNAIAQPTGTGTSSIAAGSSSRANNNLESDPRPGRAYSDDMSVSEVESDGVNDVDVVLGKGKISIGEPTLTGATIAFESLKKIRLYLGTDDARGSLAQMGIDWQLRVAKPKLNIFSTMVANSSWQAIKAVSIMKTSDKMNLVRLLTDDSRMGEYDDMFDFSTMILKVDGETSIRRVCFKGIWPTAPRDFVLCTTWQLQNDGSILIATMSADDSLFAQQKGYVRANIQISGYCIQPYSSDAPVSVDLHGNLTGPPTTTLLSPGECKVTLVAHTELGGSLPASVINMLSTQAPVKMLTAISEIVRKS